MLKKINLDNIKVVIFDFDDTLAIHKNSRYRKEMRENEEKFLNFYKNAYLNPDIFYDEMEPCTASEQLQKLVRLCEKKNIKMYCISGMKIAIHIKAKESFLCKHYSNNIEVISTGSQALKCKVIKIIKRIHNCDLDEMLFVDDMKENVKRFKSIGIYGVLPRDVEKLIDLNS